MKLPDNFYTEDKIWPGLLSIKIPQGLYKLTGKFFIGTHCDIQSNGQFLFFRSSFKYYKPVNEDFYKESLSL